MITRMLTVCFFSLVAIGSVAADELAVTVYNSNLGVVSELRSLEFENGLGRIAFRDVPSGIDPASVRFELVDTRRKVSILEQNYAFDLVSPGQLYARYIDKRIELLDKEGRLLGGNLLAYDNQALTLTGDDGRVKIVSLDNVTETNFPLLPDGLITRPTLFWLYQSDNAGKFDCRVGYQTSGLNWQAEYVAQLDESETALDLAGWASINNTSGKTFKDAQLKLIAGDINRVQDKVHIRGGRNVEMFATADQGFEEKSFFEYHMYTLPRKATLANKEIKQISLFEPAGTPVKKIYLYQPDRGRDDVQVKVEFVNAQKTGLGMPLPAGRVRLFKADDDGSLILLGEDRIDHTPRNEKVSLAVGNAFDIKGEMKEISRTPISNKVEEREFEIELRNQKAESVVVRVEKTLWSFWEVIESTLEYEKKDASTVVYKVAVEPESSTKVRFRVRFTNR